MLGVLWAWAEPDIIQYPRTKPNSIEREGCIGKNPSLALTRDKASQKFISSLCCTLSINCGKLNQEKDIGIRSTVSFILGSD